MKFLLMSWTRQLCSVVLQEPAEWTMLAILMLTPLGGGAWLWNLLPR